MPVVRRSAWFHRPPVASGRGDGFVPLMRLVVSFLLVRRTAFLRRGVPGLLLLLGLCGVPEALAQGTAQVIVSGVPPILRSPLVADQVQAYRQGRYPIQFLFTQPSAAPQTFRFRFVLEKDGQVLAETTSEPTSFLPGVYTYRTLRDEPAVRFADRIEDLYDQLPPDLRDAVRQTGALPEGLYTLTLEPLAEDNPLITTLPATVVFSVQYAQPPLLFTPADGALVGQAYPIFSWTPVTAPATVPIVYDVLLVEVLPGQTPLQALQANRAHATASLTGQTSFTYTPDLLPLREGARYAWQVTARAADDSLPFTNDGRSEVYTFIYTPIDGPGESLASLGAIVLEPGFARLDDLSRFLEFGDVTVTETATSYVFNGEATLELTFEAPTRLTVELIDLEIQKTGLGTPVVLGGALEAGDVPALPVPEAGSLRLTGLGWRFGEGFTASADLRLAGETIRARGDLRLTRSGLFGTLEAEGRPLATLGDDLVRLEVTRLQASFPGGPITGAGTVHAFHGPGEGEVRCPAPTLTLSGEAATVGLDCEPEAVLPLVDGSDRLTFGVDRLSGTFSIDADQTLGYDLTVRGGVHLQPANAPACGLDATAALSDEAGFSLVRAAPDCPRPDPELDLGLVRLGIENLRLETLTYTPAAGWDVALALDAALRIPAFGDLRLPRLSGLRLGTDGLTLPALDLSGAQLPGTPFDVDGFGVRLTQLRLNGFTFPFFDVDRIGPGPWDLAFEAEVTLPDSPDLPACLANASFRLIGGRVEGAAMRGDIEAKDVGPCRWAFGESGYALVIRAVAGRFNGVYLEERDVFKHDGYVALQAALEVGEPFTCAGTEAADLGGADLAVEHGLNGTVAPVVPSCPVRLGPFEVAVERSTLRFEYAMALGQRAYLDADAVLSLPDGTPVRGTFTLDLVTGEFLNVNFRLDEPFDWAVPADDPVLTFRLERAELSEDGFLVDGRQTLRLGPDPLGVTFDNLRIDLETQRILGGRALFDQPFALEAGIDPATGALDFRALATGSERTLDPGVYLELGGTVVLDSTGLHTSGRAAAALAYDGESYAEGVAVDFTEDFAFGLYPRFGVRRGRADLLWDEARLAYIDETGFHPDPAILADALVPDRLPLPTEAIAYLTLRENDRLLVDVTDGGDGTVRIATRPDTPLELVLPALDPVDPPRLPVALNDVRIRANPSNPEWVSGTLTATVPADDPAFDLTDEGAPIRLTEILFGAGQVGDQTLAALFLKGDLLLFGEAVDRQGEAALYVQSDGVARGVFDLTGLDAPIQLVPGSDRVTLTVEQVQGTADVPLLPTAPGPATFALTADARLAVNGAGGPAAAAEMTLQATPHDLAVTRFQPELLADPPGLDLGAFALRLEALTALPVFTYSPTRGFDFALQLDLDLEVPLAGGERVTFPLHGVEIRDDGLTIPAQDISRSSVPGLHRPPFTLGGVELEPLALRTGGPVTVDWYRGFDVDLALDPRLDLALRLPALDDTGLVPPDGFTLTDVGLADGILTGSVTPFSPLSPVPVPLRRPAADAPELLVSRLTGGLVRLDTPGGPAQGIDLRVEGTLEALPGFTVDDPAACPQPLTFSLGLVDGGRGFEGTVSNFAPCGALTFGPVAVAVASSTLTFGFSNDAQTALLDGSVTVTLPGTSPTTPTTATGSLRIDLLQGTLAGGAVQIEDPFRLDWPTGGGSDPLFAFTVTRAELSAAGLRLQAQGTLDVDPAAVDVQFNDLLLGLDDFRIAGGSATIDAGVGAEIALQPLRLDLVAATAPLPAGDAARLTFGSALTLDSRGLVFSGTGTAFIRFGGTVYPSLRLVFENDFALNPGVFGVRQGRAAFYLDEGATPATEPLAVLDQNGFRIGGGVLAILPDTLGLPTRDVAYVVLKDAQGQPLIDVQENPSTGGYTLGTQGAPLPLVLAGLGDGNGPPPTALVAFDLTTDATYTPTGGSVTLETPADLRPALGLPLTLTRLTLDGTGGFAELEAEVRVDLPPATGAANAPPLTASARLTAAGLADGRVTVGTYTTHHDATLPPAFRYTFGGTLPGANQPDAFTLDVMGMELEVGATKRLALSGTLSSTLLADDAGSPVPIFYAAAFEQDAWTFALDAAALPPTLPLGLADLTPNPVDPFEVTVTDDAFRVAVDGVLSFENLVGEPLEVTVDGLAVGVTGLQSTPQPLFALDAVTLPDQHFALFDDAVTGTIRQPTLAVDGRVLRVASSDGDLTFMDETIAYQGLAIGSDGSFTFGQIETNDIELLEQYVVLRSLALSNADGALALEAGVRVTLPEPVASTADATIRLRRGAGGQVDVTTTGPSFDVNQTVPLGDFAEFRLTRVGVSLDVMDPVRSGVYANGVVRIAGQDRIRFGDDANFPNNPGLGFSPSTFPRLQYNATGNAAFSFDHSFFTIRIAANAAVSDQEAFRVVLGGTAGLRVAGVSGELDYEGFTVTADGVEDIGNLTGSGSLQLMSFVTLELGRFGHREDPSGFTISLPDGTGDGPQDLEARAGDGTGAVATPTRQVSVTEVLCFGPCDQILDGTAAPGGGRDALRISLGGAGNGDSGGFSGGIERVLFYTETDGTRFLSIDNVSMAVGNHFALTASMAYENGPDGFLLRAAGAGMFDFGGTQVAAAVAGTFANRDNELSFGLFVAASARPGIPLIPGIIELNGAGGGFFYKPVQEDLDQVVDVLATPGFNYTPVRPGGPPRAADLSFAMMLYAQIGIGGSAGQFVVEGQTFLQLSNQNLYLDVRGTVLGLDGENAIAGTRLEAGMYAAVIFDPFFLDAGVIVSINVPATIDGTSHLNFFMGEHNGALLWGVIGHLEVGVYGGIVTADGEFLACADGFLLEAGLGFEVGIPVLKVESEVRGSIWLIDDPNFSMPFGAYVTFEAEACAGICITAEARAAFVTRRPSGFELFAAVKGCVDLLLDEACVSAWASFSNDGVDGGLGSGSHGDLVDRAEAQRDRFRQRIEDLRAQLQAAKDALSQPQPMPSFALSAADLRRAGARLYLMSLEDRQAWGARAVQIEQGFYGAGFLTVYNQIWNARPTYEAILASDALSPEAARQRALDAVAAAEQTADVVLPRLSTAVQRAVRFESQAEQAFDDMLAALAQSPVRSVVRPDTTGPITRSPSFDVDEALAAQQAGATDQLRGELAALDEAFRTSIADLAANVDEIDQLLAAQVRLTQMDTAPVADGRFIVPPIRIAGIEIEPSVNGMAATYSRAIEAMEAYYARLANREWNRRAWLLGLHGQLRTNTASIQTSINSITNRFVQVFDAAPNTSQGRQYPRAAGNAARRFQMVLALRDDLALSALPPYTRPPQRSDFSSPQELLDYYDGLRQSYDDYHDSNTAPSARTSIRQAAVQNVRDQVQALWYDIHDLGLPEAAYQVARRVSGPDGVSDQRRQALQPLRSTYGDATDLMEQVYASKASLVATLYGMVDNYVTWRSYFTEPTDSLVAAYRQQRSRLEDALAPPTIAGIRATPQRQQYFNTTRLDWTAQHPLAVAEASYQLEPYGDADTETIAEGITEYLSVGSRTSVNVIDYKRAAPRPSDPNAAAVEQAYASVRYSVGIRVRGPAGNTAIRRGEFEMAVAPGGTGTPGGSAIEVQDASPPAAPILALDAFYESTSRTEFVPVDGFNNARIFLPVTRERYWTNTDQTIRLFVIARDDESDITGFEYAVGTTAGGTDVIAWTSLQGTRGREVGDPSLVNLDAQTRFIGLQPGQPYYVSVRVTNGAGLTSPVTADQKGVVFDPTPPSDPSPAYRFTSFPPYLFPTTPPVTPPSTTPPPLTSLSGQGLTSSAEIDAYNAAIETDRVPQVTASWTASTDEESGLWRYEYCLSERPERPEDCFTSPRLRYETTSTSVTLVGGPNRYNNLLRDFDDELYVHVRAVNHAQSASGVLTLGPLVPKDPTAPTRPGVQGWTALGAVRVYVPTLSFDPETNLAGYQYAIGTSPGGTDVRPWPTGGTVDVAWQNNHHLAAIFNNLGNPAPFIRIPQSDLVDGRLYVCVRAVNTQGQTSAVSCTGPFVRDGSPPPAPSVRLSLDGGQLTIEGSNLYDPESGVVAVHYQLDDPNDFTYDPHPWKTFRSVGTPLTSPTSHARTVDVSGVSNLLELRVGIRVTNAVGRQTVTWQRLTFRDVRRDITYEGGAALPPLTLPRF